MHKFFNSRKSVWFILTFGFVLRLIYAVIAYSNNVMQDFNDDLLYKHLSDVMLSEGLLPHDLSKIGASSIVGPGIAWLNLPFLFLFSNNWMTLFFVSCLLSISISYMIYLILLEISTLKVAIIAALWSTVYLLFLKYIPTAGKDLWMTVLFTAIFYSALKSSVQRYYGLKYLIYGAILFSILVHVDERYLAYYPVVILPFLYTGSARNYFKENVKRIALFTIVFVLLLLPWLYRNYLVYDRIVIISPRTTAITDKIFGYQNQDTWVVLNPDVNYLSPAQIDSVCKGLKSDLLFPNVTVSDQIRAMRNGNIPERFSLIDQIWNSTVQLWEPFDFYDGWSWNGFVFDGKWSLRHNLSISLTYGVTIFFALIGLIYLFRKKRALSFWFLIPFSYQTLIHALFIPYSNYRYRLPIEPLILIAGVMGAIYFWERIIKRAESYNILGDKYNK